MQGEATLKASGGHLKIYRKPQPESPLLEQPQPESPLQPQLSPPRVQPESLQQRVPISTTQKMPVCTRQISLTAAEQSAIIIGKWLDDSVIHGAQLLLERQTWGKITGFKDPLLLHRKKLPSASQCKQLFVQIFNPNGHHWVVATNIGCDALTVRLYDSCYSKGSSADKILSSLLQTPEDLMVVDVMNVQQQKGGSDCRVFVIAFATSLVFGECPTHRQYTQKQMRQHLVQCLVNKEMTRFPSRKVNQKYLSEIRHSYSVLVICTCHEVARGTRIQCDHCHKWYHIDCIKMPLDSPCLNDSFTWFCASCT